MPRVLNTIGAVACTGLLLGARTHNDAERADADAKAEAGTSAASSEMTTETPTVYYSMTDIFQPNFQAVADTAFYAYNDDGELDSSLLTDEQWATMKAGAETLKSVALQFAHEPDIQVAEPGEQLFNEGQGFIASEAVQEVIDKDPNGFRGMMAFLANEADGTLAAIEDRDAAALSESSDRLYAACKTCHTMYWYPGRK